MSDGVNGDDCLNHVIDATVAIVEADKGTLGPDTTALRIVA